MTLTSASSLEETLNAYIADEYFASLQYKMAKVVAKGKALEYSNNIFGDNGDEEDEHFDEIVEYAQSLNIPVQINPKEMESNCTTPFVEIHDGDTTAQLVAILISAEKKAIEGYEIGLKNEEIIKEHPELTQFLGEKLNDERGHLKELEDLESNIKADGKVVPQADNNVETEDESNSEEDDSVKVDDKSSDTIINDKEDEDEKQNSESNESTESHFYTNELLRKIQIGEASIINVTKNLISYISESTASDFADYANYFNSDLARETSQYNENQCKNKFVEMLEDGMLNESTLLNDLMEYVGESEIEEFSKGLGYVADDVITESEHNPSVVNGFASGGLSFINIFKDVKID